MQTWSYGRGALGISLAGAILVGCGGAQSPIGVPLNSPSGFLTTQRTHQSVTYEVIHSFRPRYKGNMNDGRHPAAGLVDVNGTLYGTTFYGGTDGCGSGDRKPGCGTVYTITTSGAESVLYRFTGGVNGQNPNAGVVNAHGMLFGTTSNGGNYGFGTIFSVTPSGAQTVLHSFAGQTGGRRTSDGDSAQCQRHAVRRNVFRWHERRRNGVFNHGVRRGNRVA